MERLHTSPAAVVTWTCSACGALNRELADENDGINTYDERDLRYEIRKYMSRCVKQRVIPDGFAFAIENQIAFGSVPGAVIERILNEELTWNERG